MSEISIIVPIYNVERYLKACLDSILAQTYPDFEVILVDDGSIDNSSAICQEYVRKDSRFKYFRKPNGGLASARNYGLYKSIGAYVIFFDSDDLWVSNKTLETLLDVAKETSADIVRGEYVEVDENGFVLDKSNINQKKRENSHKLLSNYEFVKYIISGENFIWLFLYRREIFNSLLFNERQLFQEDIDFNIRLFSQEWRNVYVPFRFYAYRKRSNSLVATVNIYKLQFSFQLSRLCHEFASKTCDEKLANFYHAYSIVIYYSTLRSVATVDYIDSYHEIVEKFQLKALRRDVIGWIFKYRCKFPVFVLLPIDIFMMLVKCKRYITKVLQMLIK